MDTQTDIRFLSEGWSKGLVETITYTKRAQRKTNTKILLVHTAQSFFFVASIKNMQVTVAWPYTSESLLSDKSQDLLKVSTSWPQQHKLMMTMSMVCHMVNGLELEVHCGGVLLRQCADSGWNKLSIMEVASHCIINLHWTLRVYISPILPYS